MRFPWMLSALLFGGPLLPPVAAGSGAARDWGNEALAAGLWEVAAHHFESRLAERGLPAAEKPELLLRLAETRIREGRGTEAIKILATPDLSKHPATPFWQAQAQLVSGNLTEALDLLLPRLDDESAAYSTETTFTIANLQLALDQPQEALATLSLVAGDPANPWGRRAMLHQAEILLDLDRFNEAREILPPADALAPADQPLATLIDGRLLLAEGQSGEAASRFQALVDQTEGQTLRVMHLAAAGLAEALAADGAREAAVVFLLGFIQRNQDSPHLDLLFGELERLLPESVFPADPILERLGEWATPPEIPPLGLIADDGGAHSAPGSATTPPPEFLGHALYLRAAALLRAGSPTSAAEARRTLARLRLEFPGSRLANRALFLLAQQARADGDDATADHLLAVLRETATTPALRGRAAFLAALAACARGEAGRGAGLFAEAAELLPNADSRSAAFNSGVLLLTENPAALTIGQIQETGDPAVAADLELERALAQPDPAARRVAIEDFLGRAPRHRRVLEARLAAAEAALAAPEPDLSFARAQVETIAAAEANEFTPPAVRVALVALRVADLGGDHPAAIEAARELVERFPDDPAATEARFILGRLLFESRNFNEARIVLERLAAGDGDPGRAQAAWLLAARAAALVATSQSQLEALPLFDKAIAAEGPLRPLARLEQARLMIDMNRIPAAVTMLREWFASLGDDDPLHLPAGILLGEALYAGGGSDPAPLEEALAVYDQLLAHADRQPAVVNRLQYLRGRTLEQIPDPAEPSGRRERQAFTAYYSVLETEGPPAEWHYFELCGFRALALLEKAGRWPAAVACARKIASFGGPRAEEAATRASQLQLKHMIWEN